MTGRRTRAEISNTVILTYLDGDTNKEISVTHHNLGMIQQQGGVVAVDLNFPGASNGTVANAIAARELKGASAELSRATFKCKRTCSGFRPGDVFKLTWPDYGVSAEIMRIVEIDFGTPQDRTIRIVAVQDAFGGWVHHCAQ